MLTHMDKFTAMRLRTEVAQAVQAVADKHGLTLRVLDGRYSEDTFTPRLELKLAQTGDDRSSEKTTWVEVSNEPQ